MKVFLSYAHPDRKVARKLAAHLSEAGHRVWFADDALFPGQNVALETGKALDRSEALVVLLSPHAMESDSVRREVEFALGAPQYRGRLIPVLVRPTADIPWILKKFPIVKLGRRFEETAREIEGYVRHGFELAPAAA